MSDPELRLYPPDIHAICEECWAIAGRGAAGGVRQEEESRLAATCRFCGKTTRSGLLVQAGPKHVRFFRERRRVSEAELRTAIARIVAEHWRRWAVALKSAITPGGLIAHPLVMVLNALDGETEPNQLGVSGRDADAIRALVAGTNKE